MQYSDGGSLETPQNDSGTLGTHDPCTLDPWGVFGFCN